jgi:hypothetical protein
MRFFMRVESVRKVVILRRLAKRRRMIRTARAGKSHAAQQPQQCHSGAGRKYSTLLGARATVRFFSKKSFLNDFYQKNGSTRCVPHWWQLAPCA